jgi:signal transduction histidine kinase
MVDVIGNPEAVPHLAAVAETGCRSFIATPLRSHDGSVVGVLSMGFSKEYPVPEQYRQLLEIYARHGADFIARLRFEQALRAAERKKDEFLAMLAHELRSPLAPLATALELIRHSGGKQELADKACATMDRQLGQLKRLVDDLLDVSRIASHKLELRPQDLTLDSVLHHAVEVCRPLIDRRKQVLDIALPEQPVHVHADPVRLAQVFSNLITNASKYTGLEGRIRVTAERIGPDVEVSVIDAGCGISPELLPRVFDLFMQVDRTSDRSGGGLGIGLSLVKRLVEMHNGTVSAQSEGIGRGSRFVVRLPAKGSASEGDRASEAVAGVAPQR